MLMPVKPNSIEDSPMKNLSNTFTVATVLGSLAFFASTHAVAEYRVSAFSATKGFSALINDNLASAEQVFANRDIATLDYSAANNLCVTQILGGEYDAAIASCSYAIPKVRSAFKHGSLSRRNEVKAAIYSNLAVAKAMNGDLTGAQTDLGKALALNARDKNAVQNKGYITNEKLVSS
jgi:hypothetical protein